MDGDAHREITLAELVSAIDQAVQVPGNGSRNEKAKSHRDAARKEQQQAAQDQVVLVDEHQAGGHPDVEQGQSACQDIPQDKRITQMGQTPPPTQTIGEVENHRRDHAGEAQIDRQVE